MPSLAGRAPILLHWLEGAALSESAQFPVGRASRQRREPSQILKGVLRKAIRSPSRKENPGIGPDDASLWQTNRRRPVSVCDRGIPQGADPDDVTVTERAGGSGVSPARVTPAMGGPGRTREDGRMGGWEDGSPEDPPPAARLLTVTGRGPQCQ